MNDAKTIIKNWCAACGMPEPSDGECHALEVALSQPSVGAAPDERAAFETWASHEGKRTWAIKRQGDGYEIAEIDAAWAAWEARAAFAAQSSGQAQSDDERLAMEAVMESVDPATWPGLTAAQRCSLGRFAKPQPAEPVGAVPQEAPSDAECGCGPTCRDDGAAICRYGAQPSAIVEPVAYLIDWPDEPELGHYIAEAPTDAGRCRALVLRDAAPVAAQPQRSGNAGELPPLPDWMERYTIPADSFSCDSEDEYLADRMREYARAALAAMEKQK